MKNPDLTVIIVDGKTRTAIINTTLPLGVKIRLAFCNLAGNNNIIVQYIPKAPSRQKNRWGISIWSVSFYEPTNVQTS